VSERIRIALIDDHELMRAGLRRLLEEVEGLQVVAEGANGREALDLARRHAPDLLLLDVALPILNGIEACARVLQRAPEVRVLMLSMYANESYALRSLRAGAAGYVLKTASAAELEVAIRAALAGHTYVSPELNSVLLQRHPAGAGAEPCSPLERLTRRQREVLQLIAEGHSTTAIAEMLHLSAKTVETHRANLMQELEIRDVPGLVRFALRFGLVRPDATSRDLPG